jgi:hypothetical protein
VFGRHHDGDLLDDTVGQQLRRNTQGKRRFARSRGGHGQKITWLGGKVPHQCPTLPAP